VSTLIPSLLSILLAALTSYILSIVVERNALRLGLVKAPNERSSHVIPTARGGGAGLALVGVVGCGLLALNDAPLLAVVSGLGAIIAVMGFIDDLRDVSVTIRLGVQAASVIVFVVSTALLIGDTGDAVTAYGIAILCLTSVAGIWWINAFNFMDGIDGIAASQAGLVLVGAALLWLYADSSAFETPVFGAMMTIAGGTGGLLLRNWPPAKIFMGDVGSTFLGFVLFAVVLITVTTDAIPMASWIILLSVFVTDSTITIMRRTCRGERPWHAHRRHAYQQLSRRWGHQTVTLLYASLTALWAFPLAVASLANPSSAVWLVLASYIPLSGLAVWAGAGARDER